ncbi:MAG: pseudouridine synthase [Flavobacteriaceae bacterium]|nr:pseudouridine synthase [Flavobacteriaceae bacterium]
MNNCTHKHFIIYKPYNFLSQFVNNQTKRTNKKLLGDLFDFPVNTMAIGRLDEKSEGLLLLTTDGKISEFIRSNLVEKEYYVQVDGAINEDAIGKLKTGVIINVDGNSYKTKPCKASIVKDLPSFPERSKKTRDQRHGPTSWVSITLKEGKFRQVRKMTANIGFPTLRLIRVRIGNIKLDKMKSGEVLEINDLLKVIKHEIN